MYTSVFLFFCSTPILRNLLLFVCGIDIFDSFRFFYFFVFHARTIFDLRANTKKCLHLNKSNEKKNYKWSFDGMKDKKWD